jgi:hypothetical protein
MIWYPTDPHAEDVPTAPYLSPRWWLHAVAWGVAAKRVVTHSVALAPVASGDERFPVLLFSPAGWAPYFYASMLEELASHGYIVVALAHDHEMIPNTIFTDGRRHWFRKAAVAGALTVSKRPHDEDVRERGAVVDTKADDLRFASISSLASTTTPTFSADGSITGESVRSATPSAARRRRSRVGWTHGSRRAPTWTVGCGGTLTAPPSTDRVS